MAGLKDQIAQIKAVSHRLMQSVDDIEQATQRQDATSPATVTAVASAFPALPGDSSGTNDQLASLRAATSQLQASGDSLDQLSKTFQLFQDLMASTPTTWPLQGGVGIITTRFGWTTNPFTKQGYMHTGVDIAWAYGTPVLATADGKVVQTGQTDDLGNYIMVQHKYGFYTRYAHLSRIVKFREAIVKRGDLIGYVGSTGLSTGPHLHYEVRLGSQYINPTPFLAIKPENTAIAAFYARAGD